MRLSHLSSKTYFTVCVTVSFIHRHVSLEAAAADSTNGCRQGGMAGVKGRRETEVPGHIYLSSLHHSTPSFSEHCKGIVRKVTTELSTLNFWKKWLLLICLQFYFTQTEQLIKVIPFLCKNFLNLNHKEGPRKSFLSLLVAHWWVFNSFWTTMELYAKKYLSESVGMAETHYKLQVKASDRGWISLEF